MQQIININGFKHITKLADRSEKECQQGIKLTNKRKQRARIVRDKAEETALYIARKANIREARSEAQRITRIEARRIKREQAQTKGNFAQ